MERISKEDPKALLLLGWANDCRKAAHMEQSND
jgi:hypothetical protein